MVELAPSWFPAQVGSEGMAAGTGSRMLRLAGRRQCVLRRGARPASSSPQITRFAFFVEGFDPLLPVLSAHGAIIGFDLEGISVGTIELGGLVERLLRLSHRNWCIVGNAPGHNHDLLQQPIRRAQLV